MSEIVFYVAMAAVTVSALLIIVKVIQCYAFGDCDDENMGDDV